MNTHMQITQSHIQTSKNTQMNMHGNTHRPPSGAEAASMYEDGRKPNAAEKYGLVYVRGCEVG